jgi:hypothetical protein
MKASIGRLWQACRGHDHAMPDELTDADRRAIVIDAAGKAPRSGTGGAHRTLPPHRPSGHLIEIKTGLRRAA